MRKVLFACAAEATFLPDSLARLKSESTRWVEVLRPTSAGVDSDPLDKWLADARVDLLVLIFGRSMDGPGEVAAASLKQQILLSGEQRASLVERAPVVVGLSRSDDSLELPADLRHYRQFDLSSPDAYEALRCHIVHDQSRPAGPTPEGHSVKAAVGVSQLLIGLGLTIVGRLDSTRDSLMASLGPNAQYLHYVMTLAVVGLFISGVLALLWPLVEPSAKRLVTWLPKSRFVRKPIAVGIAITVAVVFALFTFPPVLTVESTVQEHLPEWSRRLDEARLGSGAFREHPSQGIGQAWLTAQALTGLLLAMPSATSAEAYGDALAFLQRARIGAFGFTGDGVSRVTETVRVVAPTLDLSLFPPNVPSRAYAYDLVAFAADVRSPDTGVVELPKNIVTSLDSQQTSLIDGSPTLEGWGYFAQFEWGVTEVAGWVAVAGSQALQASKAQRIVLSTDKQELTRELVRAAVSALMTRQIPETGGFSPISDTSQQVFARTYSTVMALWGLSEATAPGLNLFEPDEVAGIEVRMHGALRWLHSTAQPDGWRVNPRNASDRPFLGLTAQTLCVIGRLGIRPDANSETTFNGVRDSVLKNANAWINRDVTSNDRIHDSDRYLFPTTRVTEGTTFLWYPWVVALMDTIGNDQRPERRADADAAGRLSQRLRAKAGIFSKWVEGEYNYAAAESLIGFRWVSGPILGQASVASRTATADHLRVATILANLINPASSADIARVQPVASNSVRNPVGHR